MALIAAMLGCQILLLNSMQITLLWVYSLVLLATFALAIKQVFSFVSAPSLKAREKNEAVIAINMLIGYLVVIVAACVSNGIAWSLV
jgi:4-hydroxybenzoate polyprenyltransferase